MNLVISSINSWMTSIGHKFSLLDLVNLNSMKLTSSLSAYYLNENNRTEIFSMFTYVDERKIQKKKKERPMHVGETNMNHKMVVR